MNPISNEDKIEFLKIHFPKPSYSIPELAVFFGCVPETILYWMQRFETPRFRVTRTPMVWRDNLINFLLKADMFHENEESNTGLRFCIEDLRQKKLRK